MTKSFDFSATTLQQLAQSDVNRALQEDVGAGDLTAGLIDPNRMARARVLARESAVVCGQAWAQAAILALDPQAQITWYVQDGGRCEANQVVFEVEGRAQALLTAERTALNFLQLLSAVATKTATYVAVVAGTRAAIVDTRKTLPGLRLAQKYAVRCGGGTNHRVGLYDAVLIKENHIAAAGGIPQVLRQAEQIAAKAAFVEISGGVTLDGLRELAETGVDRISIGALTKDVKATDYSMRFDTFAGAQ